MPTTTNYGWTTPADTDLVKDGAAAIRTLGSSIDTTTKNLNPQTTTGAIAYRSATSNVNTSLAIGTAGQILRVNSGATAPEWATPTSGGMTLLSTTTLSGVATVTISSIDQTYNEIQIWCDGMKSTDNNIDMRVNGSTSSIYKKIALGSNNTATGALATSITQVVQLQDSAEPGMFRMTCKGYTETDSVKIIVNNGAGRGTTGTGAVYNQANYINIGAINSVTFYTADTAANFTAGSIRIFGVK